MLMQRNCKCKEAPKPIQYSTGLRYISEFKAYTKYLYLCVVSTMQVVLSTQSIMLRATYETIGIT